MVVRYVTRVEVALCSTEEEATEELSVQPVGLTQPVGLCSGADELSVQPVGLTQPVGRCSGTEEEEEEARVDSEWEADEEGAWVHVSFQLLADARPMRPARIEKDFILLQMFKSMSI